MTTPAVALRRLVRIINGGTPTPDLDNWDGEIPWATPVDLGRANGFSLSSTGRNLTTKGALSGSTIVTKGSVLLSTRAPIGYAAINNVPMAFNQGCKALVPAQGVSAPFLRYALTHVEPQLQSMGQGSTFMELSASALATVEIPFPSTDVQIQIVDFLDRETSQIDALMSRQERLIELLGEKRLAILAHAVTKGLDPSAPTKPSGIPWIGDTPAHWTASKVKHHFSATLGKMLQSSKNMPEGSVMLPYLRAGNIQPAGIDVSEVKTMLFTPSEAAELNLRAGDLVVVEGGAIGRSDVLKNDLIGWGFQNHVIRVRARSILSTQFLDLVLKMSLSNGLISNLSNHAAIPSLSSDKLLNLEFSAPPADEAMRICSYVHDKLTVLSNLTDSAESVIRLLKERRSAIISAAVSGRIKVDA